MTLFDLEGTVSLDTSDVISAVSKVSVLIDSLAEKMNGFDGSGLAGSLASMIGTVLGGEILALGSELSFGNIGIHIDLVNGDSVVEDAQTLYSDIEEIFSTSIPIKDPTLPKLEGDFLDDVTATGNGIANELTSAAEWEVPVPKMPNVSSTVSSIQSFWNAVKSQLDLSVTATIKVQQHGGGYGNSFVGSKSDSGGFIDWAVDTLNTLGRPIDNLLNGLPMFASGINYVPQDNYLAFLHRGEAVLPRREAEEYRAGRSARGSDTTALLAEIRALGDRIERMGIYMDKVAVGHLVAETVSQDIAREAGVFA